jgi:hypothetical protein
MDSSLENTLGVHGVLAVQNSEHSASFAPLRFSFSSLGSNSFFMHSCSEKLGVHGVLAVQKS